MSLAQILNIYFDTTRYGQPSKTLLPNLTSSQSGSGLVSSVGLDVLTVQIWPRVPSTTQGGSSTTIQMANPGGLVFNGKQVGNLNAGSFLWDSTGFSESVDANGNYFYSATLNLNLTALTTALAAGIPLSCMGELYYSSSPNFQRFQWPVTIYPPVTIGSEGSPTTGTPGYYTSAQTDSGFVKNYNSITALSGGTSGCLDAIPTAVGSANAVPNGIMVIIPPISGVIPSGSLWQLQTSTAATVAGSTQRGVDYNSSTNTQVWTRLL